MFLSIYITLIIFGLIGFFLSLIKIEEEGKQRQMWTGILAMLIFFYLAFTSMDLQTANCQNTLVNITDNGTFANFNYSYDCEVNVFTDRIQMLFNWGMAILSMFWVLTLMFKDWTRLK